MASGKPSMAQRAPRRGELPWNDILRRAKQIVLSYDTGVTLRQLYYRLVSEGLMPNRQQSYKTLSAKTAAARREGWFPALIDRTRDIERYRSFNSPEDALEWLTDIYRRPRTEGQEWSIYIGVEKHGLTTQLMAWFADFGIPVMALGGYSSQTFVDVVANDVHKQDRKSVLLYAGDFDASGMDIDRDFIERAHIFDETVRVALTADIVRDYNLPPMPGKTEDSRSTRFMLEHGKLVQVELDALAPNDLRKLYQEAIDGFWDNDSYEEVMRHEREDDDLLSGFTSQAQLEDWERASDIIGNMDVEHMDYMFDVLRDRFRVLGLDDPCGDE
jgi:hypothetical protein